MSGPVLGLRVGLFLNRVRQFLFRGVPVDVTLVPLLHQSGGGLARFFIPISSVQPFGGAFVNLLLQPVVKAQP